MVRKNKALAIALLLFIAFGAPIGCSGDLGGKPKPQVVQAEDGGEEEVLTEDDDRDEFGRPKEEGAGGFFMSVTYLGMSLAGALLPFLFLL
jgi:hypothetical protein